MRDHPLNWLYGRWNSMIARCLSKDHPRYKDWGGRGITVCNRWLNFERFLEDMGVPERSMQLDRIDNDGDYEPDNCRWTTAKEQRANQRKR